MFSPFRVRQSELPQVFLNGKMEWISDDTGRRPRQHQHHECDCRLGLNAEDVKEDVSGRMPARWSMRP